MSANFGDWGVAPSAAQTTLNNAKLEKIADWQNAKAALEEAKANELSLRNELIELFSDIKDPDYSGTENVETPYGQLKITHKLTYSLGNADLVEKALDRIEVSQQGGNVIAERLVNWKPELSVREYKLLDASQQAIINEVLTIKPAAKSLEFKPVKG